MRYPAIEPGGKSGRCVGEWWDNLQLMNRIAARHLESSRGFGPFAPSTLRTYLQQMQQNLQGSTLYAHLVDKG